VLENISFFCSVEDLLMRQVKVAWRDDLRADFGVGWQR
jgi:hypothetical protein